MDKVDGIQLGFQNAKNSVRLAPLAFRKFKFCMNWFFVMSSMDKNENQIEIEKDKEDVREPGLLETHGTFPVWMLKMIQFITPSFLISQNPPKDKSTKS